MQMNSVGLFRNKVSNNIFVLTLKRKAFSPRYFIGIAALLLLLIAPALASADALVVINLGAGEALLLDPHDFHIIARFPTGKEPHEVTVSSDGRLAYVADSGPMNEPGKTITVVDLRNRLIRGKIDLGNYTTPHDLKLNRDNSILWVGCAPAQTVLEIETRAGKILKEWKTGQEGGWMLAVTPDDRKLFVANLEGGSVSVIDRASGNVSAIPFEMGPMGIDVSPDGREVWVGNARKNLIYVIDVSTDKVMATFESGGKGASRVKFSPDGKKVLVPHGESKNIVVFDAVKRQVETIIPLSLAPKVITISKDGRRAFVTNPSDKQVTVVDIAARKEINRIPVSARPDGVSWSGESGYRPKSEVAFTIPEKDLIPEGIAYDPATKTFFVSSTYKRKIVAVDHRGKARDFASEGQDGLTGVVGMKVDAGRRILWAISSDAGINMPMKVMDEANQGRSGVFKYDLKTGKLIKKYLLDNKPDQHFLNDLTINSKGDVYISDSLFGAVYMISQQKDELEVFIKSDQWAFPNGLDLSDDEKFLFLAVRGNIAVINMETKDTSILAPPDYRGSDGLYFYKNSLISINSTNDLMVVARYFLSGDFKRVESARAIEKDHGLLIQPTTGVIVGDEFYYIATSQLQSFRRIFKPDGSYPMNELSDVVILKAKL